MAKKITKRVKVIIPAGKATPAPPLGPALGQAGVNIGDFVTKFNAATSDKMGDLVPTVITVYEDRTFDFKMKTPPATSLIFKAANIQKGSKKANTSKVGSITKAQLQEIAERKMVDLNANDVEAAMKIIAGSARSAGIEVK
ncbi:MAG: 50S ribosomal protein L11 [Candidatus Yonathbacteria bacterium RIFCSPLOWO2_01_FULL_47_33b]|uniref:Large ribosomal subunit protein uL11 n=1 Tax=Candidatus Yonathbacteria bacterium RIFCSPLOWO2_01_FULL_47_33b TaxID=1802727 RepID=A0A1G2SFR7_9BACT|nr:MAG: 50S ribosomal protein L11 [Candidatus Yonathbacteria bacterium RIFCSPLOWO2_01_FULL_47_33b]